MENYNNIHFGNLVSKISSSEPTTGGGSASALSAMFGVALLRMAIAVTCEAIDMANAKHLEEANSSLEEILIKLESFANADAAVFSNYMAALKLPKGTKVVDLIRENALCEATLNATKSPIDTATAMVEALHIALQVNNDIKKSVVSDLYAGAEILSGALFAVLLNVDINLNSKRMDIHRDSFITRKSTLIQSQSTIMKKIRENAKLDKFSYESL